MHPSAAAAISTHHSPLLDPLMLTFWLVVGAAVLVLAAVLVARANRRFSGSLVAESTGDLPPVVGVPAQGGAPVLIESEMGIA
jgi:multisubunit Na+/H+ antiporter MnhC subunit